MMPLLLAWLVLVPLLPLLPIDTNLAWYLHLALVAGLSAVALWRLLAARAPGAAATHGAQPLAAAFGPLRLGLPGVSIGLAVLSLGLAIGFARREAPVQEMLVAALTGIAHAAFFLLCLGLLPDADADPASVRRTRLWLATALGLLLAGQLVAVLLEGQLFDPLHRPDGTLGNPNVLGTLIGATMLALIGLLALRGARLLFLLPLLPFLLLSRSRGAVAATGLTLLLLAVHWRLRALLVALGVLVVLVVIVPNPLRERVANLESEHDFSRPFLWQSAIERSAERPLGIGPGMNRYEFLAHAFDAEHPWLLHQRRGIGLTHNVFTTLWLEWGWLAGASLLVLTVFVARRLLRTRLRDDDPLALGSALGACVLFLELQVDGIEQNPVAFSVFLLLLAAAFTRMRHRGQERGMALPRPLAAAGLLAIGLTLVAGAGWRAVEVSRLRDAQALVAEFEVAHAPAGAGDGKAAAPASAGGGPAVETVREALNAAERVLPRDADSSLARFLFERNRVLRLADQQLADAAMRKQRDAVIADATAQAFAALARARNADGLDPELPELGAQFALQRFYKLGRAPDDLATYLQLKQAALALDPLDVDGRWDLAQEAQRNHQVALAEREQAAVFALEPDYAHVWYVLARLAQAGGDRERSLYCYVRAAEAVLNCQIKVRIANPASQVFFQRNLDQVDLVEVWKRVWDLRRELYF